MDAIEDFSLKKRPGRLHQLLSDLDLNLSSNPRGTDRGDYKTYIRGFYEAEFSQRQSEKNRLIEIGVRSGASIALWANYFDDVKIIGVDVVDVGMEMGPVKEYIDYPSVDFFCDDAYSLEFAESLSGRFSILIDDGPHSLKSQLRFLELYLSKMEEGGVLIIEDVQRGYRDCARFMNALPKNNKFFFEVYDFRFQSGAYDDLLFVVRINRSGRSYFARRMYVKLRSLFWWIDRAILRVKRFLGSASEECR